MSSPPYFKWYHGGPTIVYGMKPTLRASCANKRVIYVPAAPSVARLPIYIPYRPCRIAVALRSALRPIASERIRHFRYSILSTPISVPQCAHFTMKSGRRSSVKTNNRILASPTASKTRQPHCTHRSGRTFSLITWPCASFFPGMTPYTPSHITAGSGPRPAAMQKEIIQMRFPVSSTENPQFLHGKSIFYPQN